MRFLVDLYRLILIGILAAALIAGTFLVVTAFGGTGSAAIGGVALIGVISMAICIILAIGATATFVSIHDRLGEIAECSERIAAALERGLPRHEDQP